MVNKHLVTGVKRQEVKDKIVKLQKEIVDKRISMLGKGKSIL